MFASKAVRPAQRVLRVRGNAFQQNVRFASETAQKATPDTGAGAGAITGGLVGAGGALAVGYGYYHFSGAKSAVQYAHTAKSYIDSGTSSLKVQFDEKTPDTNQAIQTLKESAQKYASFVPGGRGYVDSAFDDLDSIRKKHGSEVDEIVRETYGELRDASKKGMNMEAAGDAWNILSKRMEQLLSLTGDAAEDILNNHPELKKRLGGSTDQLKQMGQKFGPEAKKQVDETWDQINDIVKSGVGLGTADKVRKLVQDKIQKIREISDKAFEQGYEQLKPMLEKSPEVKKFVEQNMDQLKQSGSVSDVVKQVQSAVSSGSTKDLEQYMQKAKEGAQQFSSSQLSQWLEMVPNGGQIIPQLQKIKEIAESRGEQAEQLAKETISEIKTILDKKSSKVEQLYESGKQDVEKK